MNKNPFNTLSKTERILYIIAVAVVILSGALSDKISFINTVTSLVGVTTVLFVASGNIIGQLIAIPFALLYAYISYNNHYYGEMLTFLLMSLPASVISVVSWYKHRFNNEKTKVEIIRMKRYEYAVTLLCAIIVTIIFYFILKLFGTESLMLSTISVTTSFTAAYLSYRRAPAYAIAYCTNDVILVLLWSIKSVKDLSYLPVVACFVIFLMLDIYGFVNWVNMRKEQEFIKNQLKTG